MSELIIEDGPNDNVIDIVVVRERKLVKRLLQEQISWFTEEDLEVFVRYKPNREIYVRCSNPDSRFTAPSHEIKARINAFEAEGGFIRDVCLA
jgi:hypothetical protein